MALHLVRLPQVAEEAAALEEERALAEQEGKLRDDHHFHEDDDGRGGGGDRDDAVDGDDPSTASMFEMYVQSGKSGPDNKERLSVFSEEDEDDNFLDDDEDEDLPRSGSELKIRRVSSTIPSLLLL